MSYLREGIRYYREGRILKAHIGRTICGFLVAGESGKHTVIIDLRLRKVSCSCWGFTIHKKCRHLVCVLAYLRDHYPELYAVASELAGIKL